MQARIAPMGKLAKTDETLLAKYHGLRKVSRDRNELCNHGGVAEWSNAPVLKTGIPQGIVGSSARRLHHAQFSGGICTQAWGSTRWEPTDHGFERKRTPCITRFSQQKSGGVAAHRLKERIGVNPTPSARARPTSCGSGSGIWARAKNPLRAQRAGV